MLDTGEPWTVEPFQKAFLKDFFSGVPECWLIVPEGNAKTTLMAGLALYHCQHTQEAYAAVAASSRDQAEWLFRQAEGLVHRSESIEGLFRPQEGYRRIRCDSMRSRVQIFAADDRTGDGAIGTLYILDELHRHRDLRLYRTWNGKLQKRDGQIVAISTAGVPGEEFETEREKIRRTGERTQLGECHLRVASSLHVMHEWAVPDDADADDLALVKKANPLKAITIPTLKRKHDTPTMTHEHWRRFVCNLPTRTSQSAIQEAEWYAAATSELIPEGEPVWVGLDVAWKWDTTAAVPLWMPDYTQRVLGPASILVPPRDGTSLDPGLVEDALVRIHDRNPVHTVVMDPSKAEQLGVWIEQTLGATVIERGASNIPATEDYEKFMEALRNGWLKHSGDEGLRQHALNAVVRLLPGGDARFDRPSSGRLAKQDVRVIDALIAAAMVHAVAALTFDDDSEYLVMR